MTAATEDINTRRKEQGDYSYPVAASTTIYLGTLVCIDSNGYAIPAAQGASNTVVGVAREQVTAVAAGSERVMVDRGVFLLACTAITQAMVGRTMFVVDDQTVDDAVGANSTKAGVLEEYVSATSGWVRIGGPLGHGITKVDAGGSYTSAEQDLLNEIKNVVNYYLLGN